MDLITRLKGYWDKHGTAVDPAYDYSQFIETSNFQSISANWVVEAPFPMTSQNTFAATNVAMYDAAVALANALAWESNSGYPELNKRQTVIHCASIMTAIGYHEGKGPESGGSVSMVFPMKVVCRTTPSSNQRRQVQAALVKWGESRGVEGICQFVVPESHGVYGNIR